MQIHTDIHTSKHTQTKKQNPRKHKIVIHSTQVKDHLDQEKNDEKMDMRQKKIYKKSTEFKFVLPLLCGMESTLKCGSFTH